MANADATLQAWIARLRGLATFDRDVAPAVAEELRTQIEQQIARGEGPDGKPWPRTQANTIPLRNAAKVLTVTAVGTTVLARIKGPEALHHLGAAAGHVRRTILPTRKLPQKAIEAIRKLMADRFDARMGGE